MVNDMRAACLEPLVQESGYQWGYYLETRDQSTRYFFHQIAKGKHVVETEYYIDREGNYLSASARHNVPMRLNTAEGPLLRQ